MAWMPIKRLLGQGSGSSDSSRGSLPPSNTDWLPELEFQNGVRQEAPRQQPRQPQEPPQRQPQPPREPAREVPQRQPPREPPRQEEVAAPHPYSAFDAIGQRGEMVRVRISQMMERLDDLKTLQADFAQILAPLSGVADELPQAKIKIAELEVLLAREQEHMRGLQRELAEVSGRAATSSNELAAATTELQRLESQLRERDSENEELRVRVRDRTVAVENMERQLFAETEQVRALTGENKSLRIEAQAADQAMTRAERELTDLGERLSLSEQDARRLQSLAGEQAVRLSEAEARVVELTQQIEVLRQRNRDLEAQLAAETAARERGESQFETEMASIRADRANLAMKLDASLGRAGTLEQLLAQVRSQLREREEMARTADRTLKELQIERTTIDRRLEGLQGELQRQTERVSEIQRLRSESDNRSEMLTKALAAKEAAMEQSQTRVTALADRMEQLGRRHEAEKAELQAANRRLVEELQNERSERALAQGALDIARETRASLQKQHEALKRAVRNLHGVDPASLLGLSMPEARVERVEESNVTPFMPPERDGRDNRSNTDMNT
ncbi:chromosome partitioning protein ParA [Methylobacterium sp. J-076]|uniref:chromosome partitioning protein ParA n=1 Tax=Methylobacterium sp. J-076 TaxID=2836655 RepID=UPI001FBBB56F|nr:chromosome partitioning protein ParA [Methylobacterium sp. J-076]MCJ2015473.1 chromosome partitioning protein ParA [Methylobacterium sp. J-076]